MKYKIESEAPRFTPVTLTLTLETFEEWERFQDLVAPQLVKDPAHKFHKDVDNVGSGTVDDAEGWV